MKKVLNIALLVSFILTVLVPLTGIHIHKLASVIFLLLSIIHTVVYRKKLGTKKFLLLALVAVSFLTGIFGMVPGLHPVILILHRVISLAVVFFAAIHIFVYHRRLRKNPAAPNNKTRFGLMPNRVSPFILRA